MRFLPYCYNHRTRQTENLEGSEVRAVIENNEILQTINVGVWFSDLTYPKNVGVWFSDPIVKLYDTKKDRKTPPLQGNNEIFNAKNAGQ